MEKEKKSLSILQEELRDIWDEEGDAIAIVEERTENHCFIERYTWAAPKDSFLLSKIYRVDKNHCVMAEESEEGPYWILCEDTLREDNLFFQVEAREQEITGECVWCGKKTKKFLQVINESVCYLDEQLDDELLSYMLEISKNQISEDQVSDEPGVFICEDCFYEASEKIREYIVESLCKHGIFDPRQTMWDWEARTWFCEDCQKEFYEEDGEDFYDDEDC